MRQEELVERLLRDNPPLHWASEDVADYLSKAYGGDYKPGPISHAVSPEVIRLLAKYVRSDHLTIETGSGQTTVALAALAKHHTCVSFDVDSIRLIKDYMETVGIPADKVRFLAESSDTALPRLDPEQPFDFAFIDGCHAYPFPALDWHYIDFHLRVGGILGMDNTEINAVHNHCLFLEKNQTYRLIASIQNPAYGVNYGASFYTKLKDDGRSPPDTRSRDAHGQLYNHCCVRKRSPVEILRSIFRRTPKVNPWD